MQVPVRGRDRLVTAPRLDRSGVDAARVPQAGRGVPQVVQATPTADSIDLD